MKRFFVLPLLIAALAPVLFSQDRAPELLFEAAQCLVTEPHHWVDLKDQKQLNLGYLEDNKTFLGEKYLYVVVYSSPKRDHGQIFDVRHKQAEHRRIYSIENSATFVVTKKGVDFPEPPLGGTWAQSQLTQAIQQITRHKWFEAQAKYLLKPNEHVQCETSLDK